MNQPDNTKGLDEILTHHREWMRGIRTDHLVGTSDEQTKQAILHWIDREVIGEEFSAPMSENMVWMLNHDERIKTRNVLRAEQRTILAQHGYKGGKK